MQFHFFFLSLRWLEPQVKQKEWMSWTVDFTSDSSANLLLLPVWLTSNGLSSVHDAGWGVACRLYMLNQALLAFLRYLQLFSNHLLPSPGLRSSHSSFKVTLPLFFLYCFFADAQSLVGVALCDTASQCRVLSCCGASISVCVFRRLEFSDFCSHSGSVCRHRPPMQFPQ